MEIIKIINFLKRSKKSNLDTKLYLLKENILLETFWNISGIQGMKREQQEFDKVLYEI